GVESGEGSAEVLAFAQDGQPGQPGLEALEAEPLEDRRFAAHRAAPLLVVIGEVLRSAQTPGTAQLAVRTLGWALLRVLLRRGRGGTAGRWLIAHQPCSSAGARESPSATPDGPAARRRAASWRAAFSCSAHQSCVLKAPCGPCVSYGARVSEGCVAS